MNDPTSPVPTSISVLPIEILMMIFTRLDCDTLLKSATRVCAVWNCLARDVFERLDQQEKKPLLEKKLLAKINLLCNPNDVNRLVPSENPNDQGKQGLEPIVAILQFIFGGGIAFEERARRAKLIAPALSQKKVYLAIERFDSQLFITIAHQSEVAARQIIGHHHGNISYTATAMKEWNVPLSSAQIVKEIFKKESSVFWPATYRSCGRI